jgi:hypothetical protein
MYKSSARQITSENVMVISWCTIMAVGQLIFGGIKIFDNKTKLLTHRAVCHWLRMRGQTCSLEVYYLKHQCID